MQNNTAEETAMTITTTGQATVELTDAEATHVEALREARAAIKSWTDYKEQATAAIRGFLGGATAATHNGEVVVTIQTRKGRASVDLKKLEAIAPDVYDQVVTFGKPVTVVNLPKRKS
jgi:hypothetical protein